MSVFFLFLTISRKNIYWYMLGFYFYITVDVNILVGKMIYCLIKKDFVKSIKTHYSCIIITTEVYFQSIFIDRHHFISRLAMFSVICTFVL